MRWRSGVVLALIWASAAVAAPPPRLTAEIARLARTTDGVVGVAAHRLDGGDTIMDFENGIDRIVLEKLGVKSFSSSGAPGTVFAHDLANGDVALDVVTSSGAEFTIQLADPLGTLNAAHLSSADFILV